ncbi:MAG: SDR family oxidoreductase [Bacteroidetes bacterium]|nr:SDR family oxidoreductase [Bacteroidota bacterium]MBS1740876.1 SDR family oxidoreductase [Bacteroidota bacterium]MBS1775820.1 SDR family oxidoreductase [Bacteroidota bacterium]
MFSLDLTGKSALIAGSSQGIGLAAAQALADLGATCFLIARNEERLQKALSTLDTSKNQQHRYLVADFSKPQEVRASAEKLASETIIHILVNNTGGPAAGSISDAIPEAFQSAFEQHLICNHLLTTTLVAGMKKAGYGRVINVISTSVKVPLKNLGVSNTIRGAVASWAKTFANELASYGITVNNVLPGATSTARLENIISNKVKKTGITEDAATEEMLSEIPAKRFGKPEEIAAMIAFLASPLAGYVNGTSIPVDGGRTGCL